MQRRATVIQIKPEKIEEYKRLHANAWPGVLRALRRANVRNYSIYLRDNTLFGYMEYTGHDFEADMAKVAEDEETQRWWQFTDPCQQPVESAGPGEWWAPMEEVFHMD
ncbi:MAG: L-rhamnose mutarotase [Gammaproteobacteria bacterium]|nr:L-rhamnose mutarotase [Gammaproteobacteria bacterium]